MGSKLSRSLHNPKIFSINQEDFADEPNPIFVGNQNPYLFAFSLHPTSNRFDDMQDGNTVTVEGDSKISPDVNLTEFKVNQSPKKNRKMEEEIKKTSEINTFIGSRTNEINKIKSDVNLINYKVDQSLEMNCKMREEIEKTKEKQAGFNSETKIILLNIKNLSDKVDQGFKKVYQRFEEIDQRFEKVDQRLDKVDQRINDVDGKLFYSLNICLIGGFFLVICSSIFRRPFQKSFFRKKRIRNIPKIGT